MSTVAIVVIVLFLILAVGGFFIYRGYMVGSTKEYMTNGLEIVVGKKWFSDYTLNIDGEDVDFTAETPTTIYGQTATYTDDSVTFGNTMIDFTSSTGIIDMTVVGETTTTTTTINAVKGQFVGQSSNIYNYKLESNILTIEGSAITFATSGTASTTASASVAAVVGSPTTIEGEAVYYTPDSNTLSVDRMTVTYDSANTMIKVETEQVVSTTPVVTNPTPTVVNTTATFTTDDGHIITSTFSGDEFGEITVTDSDGTEVNVTTTIPTDLIFEDDDYYVVNDSSDNKLIFKGNGQDLYILNVTNLNISKYSRPTTTLTSGTCSIEHVLYNYISDKSSFLFPKGGIDTFDYIDVNESGRCVVDKEYIYTLRIPNVKIHAQNGELVSVFEATSGQGASVDKYTDNTAIVENKWYYYEAGNVVFVIRKNITGSATTIESFSVDISDLSATTNSITSPETITAGSTCDYENAVVDYILNGGSAPSDKDKTYKYSNDLCIEDTSVI